MRPDFPCGWQKVMFQGCCMTTGVSRHSSGFAGLGRCCLTGFRPQARNGKQVKATFVPFSHLLHILLSSPPPFSPPAVTAHDLPAGPFCVRKKRKKHYNTRNEWTLRQWRLMSSLVSGIPSQRLQEEARVTRGRERERKMFYSVRPLGTWDCILWWHLSCIPMTLSRVCPCPQPPKVRTGLGQK